MQTTEANLSANKLIHVAVGVVRNREGEVLVSLRHPDAHQGGLWEFPGGKVEDGESVREALDREFTEELGITPTVCFPLKKITHVYEDRKVLLDVWVILTYRGEPKGLEGQPINWQAIDSLRYDQFPAANKPIIDALTLPSNLPITPDLAHLDELDQLLDSWVALGLKVAYLRQNALSKAVYNKWLSHANKCYAEHGLKLIVDINKYDPNLGQTVYGCHAKSQALMELHERPVPSGACFSASCHSLQELKRAEQLSADFAFLSPIHRLEKYPNTNALGWAGFSELVEQVSLPVYALGGVSPNDMEQALLHGAIGISGISAFTI